MREPPLSPSLRVWRMRVFAATWLSYATYYFCRKPFYISKSVLESELGTTKIDGETFLGVIHRNIADFPPLHQGGVKYAWDGEETYGMIERSYPNDQMSW